MEASNKALAMASPAAEAYREACQAINRLLGVCASGRPHSGVATWGAAQGGLGAGRAGVVRPGGHCGAAPVLDLADGPWFLVAAHLGAAALCRVDASCRVLRELNRAHGGPWCHLGVATFYGLELDSDGVFEPSERDCASGDRVMGSRQLSRVDWKGRHNRFRSELPMFREPFCGSEITSVQQADEIAYCRCRLRTDLLDASSNCGVYLEVDVLANPDNVSLAVVDFEAGGCSSVTFSPDTGAVIRERKVREAPRKVEGAYIQPLATITPGQGFEGTVGLYLRNGHLAFFRRRSTRRGSKEPELGPWETTGFVTDLTWAEGQRLTPCLAFRNEGAYRVRMTCVGSRPPLVPERTAGAYDEANWSSLDWDATEQDAPEM